MRRPWESVLPLSLIGVAPGDVRGAVFTTSVPFQIFCFVLQVNPASPATVKMLSSLSSACIVFTHNALLFAHVTGQNNASTVVI